MFRGNALTTIIILALGASGCRVSRTDSPSSAGGEASGGYRHRDLPPDAPVDPGLQRALERIDGLIAEELGIPPDKRACGVLSDRRLAWIRPDAMFYGASVPKICILAAYFEKHPEAARDLDPEVERELQLVIKRSSNDLAAKYSQLLGLDAIQRLQLSAKYRLYDAAQGGGLWSGKHYGLPSPRKGDPLRNFSHAATVRQCLRFYLLMEQGRLVSPEASAKMKEIFAAPQLEFHDSKFVRGLNGRNVTLIRKNGLWEDWHLDTARIQHGEGVCFLAGMAHHPKGDEYLERLAAAVDEILHGGVDLAPFSHELVVHQSPETFRRGIAVHGAISDDPPGVVLRHPSAPGGGAGNLPLYESPVILAGHPFNEALVSWNVDAPSGTGFGVELRVGREFDDSWSPYLYTGDWGFVPGVEKRVVFDGGRIDVDYFRSDERFDRLQYRVRAYRAPGSPNGPPGGRRAAVRVARVAVCLSDRTGVPHSIPPSRTRGTTLAPARWTRRLAVPFRTQKREDPSVAARLCSPTSVAMVMEYRGVKRPTAEVAARIYDPVHDLYGNWPRAVQTAFSYGIPGYLTRFSRWDSVQRMVAGGQPLIISVRVAKGQLTGAPYESTDGHLLVVTGFDSSGDVCVNDPAASDAESGRGVYRRSELDEVWMRNGGTAYVLLPRE